MFISTHIISWGKSHSVRDNIFIADIIKTTIVEAIKGYYSGRLFECIELNTERQNIL